MLPTLLRFISYIRFLKPQIPTTIVGLYCLAATLPDGSSSPNWQIAVWLGMVAHGSSLLHRYLIPYQDAKDSISFLQKHKVPLVRSIALSYAIAILLTFFVDRPVPLIVIGSMLGIYLFVSTRFFSQRYHTPWRRLTLVSLTILAICWSNWPTVTPLFTYSGLIGLGLFLQNALFLRNDTDSRQLVDSKKARNWQKLGMKIITPLMMIAGAWIMYHVPHRLTQRTLLFMMLIGSVQGCIFFCKLSILPTRRLYTLLNWILLTPICLL